VLNEDRRTQRINVAIIVWTYIKSGNARNISAQNSSSRYRLQSLLESQHGKEIILFSTLSETSLGLTQPPAQWAEGALAPEAKRPKCDTDHSSPYSTSLRMTAALLALPSVPSWLWKGQTYRDWNMQTLTVLLFYVGVKLDLKEKFNYRSNTSFIREVILSNI
jgi:hypothetical protein